MKLGKSKANAKSRKLSVKMKRFKPAKKIGRVFKDPNKPKKPATPFFVFLEEFRQTYKKEHPGNRSATAVGIAEKRKVEYEKKMIAYYKNRHEEEEEVEKSESEVKDDEDEDDEEEVEKSESEENDDEDEDDEEASEDEDEDEDKDDEEDCDEDDDDDK
ncbi:High mobility group B protein 2 [Euphorbia peplus]|nr:High mobility group B protein 2 [Euphorbia peplus]